MSVWPELWTVNCRTGSIVSRTSTASAFFDRSANVLSVSYTVYIRFVCYTFVTLTFVDRFLSVTCLVSMCSLWLPRRSAPPLRRLQSIDKYILHFFFPFDIRYPYPLSDCHTLRDSTNSPLTDSNISCPFVSNCMHYMSVPHPMNTSRIRWYLFCPVLSVDKFWTCSKLWTDATG